MCTARRNRRILNWIPCTNKNANTLQHPNTTLPFFFQPKVDLRKAFSYDSEASISSESEESDDAYEDDERVVKMKEKKVKPLDHLDPKSFTWKLMNYAVSTLVCHNINTFLADVGLEVSGKK